jgi:hypothetical protein
MQIPSWAFVSAGKSLFGYKSEPDLVIVQMPEPLDVQLDILPTSLDVSLDVSTEPLDVSVEPLDVSVEPLDVSVEPLDVSLDISVEPVHLLTYEPTLYDEFIEIIRQNTLIQLLIELYT